MVAPQPRPRQDITSWGAIDRRDQQCLSLQFSDQIAEVLEEPSPANYLACGLRRSYGDSCLNREGVLLDVSHVNRFLSFDETAGILTADAGVSLSQILQFSVPRGWFLSTTPGTRFVTLGGAIANDVHGKNHHAAGAFGCSVQEINLIKGGGEAYTLSSKENSELFAATVGGLGLTGVIASASIALTKIPSAFLDVETICTGNLNEFWALSEASQHTHEHTVSWIDCSSTGSNFGRGVFSRANWSEDAVFACHSDKTWKTIPADAPEIMLNRWSVAAFNELYYRVNKRKAGAGRQHYATFFYPLDSVRHWNRLYGRGGFYQYQCVVPPSAAQDAVRELLEEITKSGQGSFLAVLKTFGARASPGMLSFPRPGATLALDFPNRGADTLALLDRLDAIVLEARGALYPAKDGRMSGVLFHQSFPRLQEFFSFVDPRMNSDFWRRVTA